MDRARQGRNPARGLVVALTVAFAAPAAADDVPAPYHYPQGTIAASGSLGVAFGGSGRSTVFAAGAGVGYAVLTGVVPGVRGMFIKGDEIGGEAAATLLLTPPLSFSVVPFAIGEAGRRFDGFGGAWIFGGGGGVLIGAPDATFGIQLGWLFRRLVYESGSLDGSGPLIGLAIRL